MNAPIRPAAVAGLFYPGQAATLRHDLSELLAEAGAAVRCPAAKALIVPHAGFVYSGSTAAAAYARLRAQRDSVRRVVLLGPVHRVAVRGLAASSASAFATPLGEVALDSEALAALADLPQVVVHDAAHAPEHSLEVQLPFLQMLLAPGFTLLPLAVGDATAEQVAQVLERLWGGPETLIVVSSDLSHYHPYDEARRLDAATAERILALTPLASFDQACGALPINGLLQAARRHGLRIERVAQCTSGDTAGDKDRVVGYAAFALYDPAEAPQVGGEAGVSRSTAPRLPNGPASGRHSTSEAGETAAGGRADAGQRQGSAEQAPALGHALLTLARRAIAERLGLAAPAAPAPPPLPALDQPGATFVTLMQGGALRGCIGSLEATRALREDVAHNAQAAALRDPRFAPLTAAEFPGVKIEVSLLSAPEPMVVRDEADALAQLHPGVDGLVLEDGWQRATFLPQVWEQLPQPADFLAHLKQKAGLAPGWWSPSVRLARYTVQKWKE